MNYNSYPVNLELNQKSHFSSGCVAVCFLSTYQELNYVEIKFFEILRNLINVENKQQTSCCIHTKIRLLKFLLEIKKYHNTFKGREKQ